MNLQIPAIDRAMGREVRSRLVRRGIPLSGDTPGRIGVSAPHFSRLLNGRARWALCQAERVSDLLGISLVDLINSAAALAPEVAPDHNEEPAA